MYRPYYSREAKKVAEEISLIHPEIPFVIFESVLLNEFLNHQIAQNTIYIRAVCLKHYYN